MVNVKILMVYTHYEVCSGRYLTEAFTRLGHSVIHIGGEACLKDAWGVEVLNKYEWKPDSPQLPQGWYPDLIIVADSVPQGYQPDFAGVPVVVIGVDNHVRDYRFISAQRYFLAHAHGPAQPVTQPDETWLPCAADIHTFTPSTIPWDEREYDVCMVGVMYPQRVQLIERLRAEGFKVFAATGLVYEEYQQAYANSRISLCVSAAGDLAQRVFETAAIGCAVLLDHTLDIDDPVTEQQLGLQGFFHYENDDICVLQVRALIGDEKALAQRGAAMMQRVVREQHTWGHRAQKVVEWYEKEYGVTSDKPKVWPEDLVGLYVQKEPELKPYLNLGCGKTHFPSAKPAGHELVDAAVYTYPLFVNIDKVEGVGADLVFDIFQYPWPLQDATFDGAIAAHLLEHVPHDIKINPTFEGSQRAKELSQLQDGWYAFFSELYRVLTPGALVHIVSPYGFSDGGITDPSHTRYLTMNTFTHSMTPEVGDGSTFKYNNGGINFQIEGEPVYRLTPYAKTLQERTGFDVAMLMGVYVNVCYDFYVRLKAVK